MPRRLASQVHLTTARLLQARAIPTPPVWYDAVMMYPPVPLPPRQPVTRPQDHVVKGKTKMPELAEETVEDLQMPFDLPTLSSSAIEQSKRRSKPPKAKAQPVEYTADRVRKQFFRDHPFEALRPQTLVERGTVRDQHPIQGLQWTRLRQHGRNPTPEEAIQFAVCLHEYHNQPLSVAYSTATAQFRSLRSEHTVATQFALNEAKFFGADFAPSESARGADLTKQALISWSRTGAGGRKQSQSIRNRFFPVWKGRTGTEGYWSRGVGYTKRWVRGMPPMFWPSAAERRETRPSSPALTADAQKRVTATPGKRERPTITSPIQ